MGHLSEYAVGFVAGALVFVYGFVMGYLACLAFRLRRRQDRAVAAAELYKRLTGRENFDEF